MMHLAIAVILLLGWIIYSIVSSAANAVKKKQRRTALLAKYGDEMLVDKLMGGMLWQGQNEELLTDSLGQPEDVDHKALKTKRKEIWKYGRTGHNRYRTRVTLENGYVVGWDIK